MAIRYIHSINKGISYQIPVEIIVLSWQVTVASPLILNISFLLSHNCSKLQCSPHALWPIFCSLKWRLEDIGMITSGTLNVFHWESGKQFKQEYEPDDPAAIAGDETPTEYSRRDCSMQEPLRWSQENALRCPSIWKQQDIIGFLAFYCCCFKSQLKTLSFIYIWDMHSANHK